MATILTESNSNRQSGWVSQTGNNYDQLKKFKYYIEANRIMETPSNSTQGKRNLSAADQLKNRLFERGIGHSPMSTFKSPLATDYANRMLLVNLNSSNSSKFSPKIIRKQVAGLPNQYHPSNQKRIEKSTIFHDRLKTTSYDKLANKQAQFLQQLTQEVKKISKAQTASHFYHSPDQVQQCGDFTDSVLNQQRRTKQLVQKLTGKSKQTYKAQAKLSNLAGTKPEKVETAREPVSKQASKSKHEQTDITLENYIRRALKNEEGLQQFLYLVSSKSESQPYREEDPYELSVVDYDTNKQIEQKLSQKYYTVSKKGLCFYVNSKPVEFIELEEWMAEKQNYQKIKNLNFFNRFRKWKTIKMWRKIVVRHSIQECSKNLEERLFFLNHTMRQCLFEIQELNLEMGQNFVILANNQDTYSLENFKAIQENNKRKISAAITQGSERSRVSVRKCFQENMRILRENMKEKQKEENEEKAPSITSHINLKDSAFQALGFPPKMSYENRSKLRKMAGKFIRFSYLVDMIHTAGLALHFRNQLSHFICSLSQSQSPANLQTIMTSEDNKTTNSPTHTQFAKLFHVKLHLRQAPISPNSIVLVPFTSDADDSLPFNPIYHIKLASHEAEKMQQNQQRSYCPSICNQWLWMTPQFDDIYKEVANKIKQSLECLKLFERWSKHRDIEKFISILEEWDDVVSESREVTENQYLDPVSIIPSFESALGQIKTIFEKSLEVINLRIRKEFTEFLNIHWEQERIDLGLFRSHQLQSPAQTIESFLKYITCGIAKIEKQAPYRIRLGAFEVNLGEIRVELVRKAEMTFNKFKEIIPEVIEERTKYVNDWLNKYINQICKKCSQESHNIDAFVSKIKNIREAEQTFEKKKELCLDLMAIEQIMETHKFGTRKKKDLESDTLKLKQTLDNQINSTFQQSFKKQAEFYSREIHKNYLPSIVKDISRLSAAIKNQKYISLTGSDRNQSNLMREIQDLQKKYEDLEQRNSKCLEYQQILNQFHGVAQASTKPVDSMARDQEPSSNQAIPAHSEELMDARSSIDCLKAMWVMYDKWSARTEQYNKKTIKSVYQDKDKLQQMLEQQRTFLKSKLKRVLGTNQVVEELNKKVEIFQRHLPIIIGLNNHLSDTHWQQINELVHKNNCPIALDSQKLSTVLFSDFVSSGIGEFKDELQEIFVKASNQIKLELQYEEIEKTWKNFMIRTKVEGKFNVIYDEKEHASVMQLIDETMRKLTEIFSNPYSLRLQLGVLTFDSLLSFVETYQKWITVQRKLVAFDRICKSIDMKKISEANSLQNSQKQYKAIFKILLPRNIDTSFNITKLVPSNNPNINQKFQQCQRLLNCLEGGVKNMLQDHRRNCPIYYQLEDTQLLRVMVETSMQQNSLSLAALYDEFICHRFLQGVVKQLKIQGERITGIITIDGENISKSEYALSADLNTTLNEVIEAVSDYTRRMMKSCRNKSLQTSLYEIVDEFNIQFLLAISKVDFSNYTGISIENSQENSESLKQYLKIMAKDTKNGIRKLKEKRSGNVLGFENLILQNLVHQTILQELVQSDIRCANQYEWIKHLRFYWEDSEQSNVSIRKMHVSLRYGKQYIGSNSRVMIESSAGGKSQYSSLDMIMSIIRSSETSCYQGSYEPLRNFTNCIAHRLEKITCTKEMDVQFGNPIKMMLRARSKIDCCYFVEKAHLLSDEAIREIMMQECKPPRPINVTMPSSLKIGSGEHAGGYYNPIFLQFPISQNTLARINRQQYRSVSLSAPNNEYLVCYLYLAYEIIANHMTGQAQLKNNHNGCHGRSTKNAKNGKNESETQRQLVSPNETLGFIRKIFHLIAELEVTDSSKLLHIEAFLESVKHRICSLGRTEIKPATETDMKILKLLNCEGVPQPSMDLHDIIIGLLVEHIQPLILPENFNAILQYMVDVYPQAHCVIPPQQKKVESMVEVKIMIGFQDCLENCSANDDLEARNTDQINIAQYSAEQLYGYETQNGLLHRIIYDPDPSDQTRTLIINGFDEKLVVYLSALVDQNTKQREGTLTKHYGSTELSPCLSDANLKGSSRGMLSEAKEATKEKNRFVVQNPLSIQIRVSDLCQIIDPKLITQFKISSAIKGCGGDWKYVDHRIQKWTLQVSAEYSSEPEKCKIFSNVVKKFYGFSIKGIWKELYRVYQQPSLDKPDSQFESQHALSEGMINSVRDFLNFLYTLLPTVFGSIPVVLNESDRRNFQTSATHACIYAVCHVYRSVIDFELEGIKMQAILDKFQAEAWLSIPENERIRPSQYEPAKKRPQFRSVSKKRYTYFDYILDGGKLIPLEEYCDRSQPERIIERGQFYLANELIHLNLITERTVQSKKLGVLLLGGANSGKTSFYQIYRTRHFEQTAHLAVNAKNKNKKQVYSRLCRVLALSDLSKMGPKLNYSSSLIFIDDLSMPSPTDKAYEVQEQENEEVTQLICSIASLIKHRAMITPVCYKKYELANVSFILSHTTGKKFQPIHPSLDSCTIKYEFECEDGSLRKVFTEILKANVLDPDIEESIFANLVDVAFNVYQEISQVADTLIKEGKSKMNNILNLQILKRMALFAAHLRFKQNTASLNEIGRFWAYLLKDNLEPYCNNYMVELKSLSCLNRNELGKENSKSVFDYLKQPTQELLYSHLYVKQQVYGNGKEVQYYGQIRKLYNSINQAIHDYNATESKHRYGYYFGLIAIDELIVKVVKISNMLLTGDYAIFTRKGSEVSALIRLVSYILGFNYKEQNSKKQQRIIDTVRETVVELTKVSLYLISVKIDDSNFHQFLQYYDSDFEAEVVGYLQAGDLHSIQATGAFDFGINQSENMCENDASLKAALAWQQKHQQKSSSVSLLKQPSSHSHTSSKEQLIESRSKFHQSQQQFRYNKLGKRELNKMRRSIRLVFQFQDLKYLRQEGEQIPLQILSQLNVDFFHEYPRESIIRFSEQSLGLGTETDKLGEAEADLMGSSNDKFGIMFQIYQKVREDLGLALNQYEECHRLYWYLVGNLSNDIKQNITKYELIFDMSHKLQEIIADATQDMELKWEEKKNLSARINEIKLAAQCEDTNLDQSTKLSESASIEAKLSEINTTLQELTQKRSLCEKVSAFFKPTLPQFTRRYNILKNLMVANSSKLKINCLVIASYFTYLSKLPYERRKSYMRKWYQECPSLSKIQASEQISSISQFFSLVTEQYMIINQQNEPYYENMMIILNSSRAVLIRDDKNKGRNWIASFDDSFASVSESSTDYLQKLEEYLAAGRNIFLEITNQQTLNNSLSNQIHNLIFIEENASTVKIGDIEYSVSNKTKVFIVVAPHIVIPEQIMSQNLYIIYQQSESDLLKPIEHQLMLLNNGDKYTQYLQYKKREECIMNECYNLQIPLANVVFDEIYADIDALDKDDPKEEDDDFKKLSIEEKKTKEDLLDRMEFLAKVGALDKHQERFDRYFTKKKQLEEIRDKINNLGLMPDSTHSGGAGNLKVVTPLQRVMRVIRKTYQLIEKMKKQNPCLPSLNLYYEVVLEAIRQGLITISLNEFHSEASGQKWNTGMFVLFVLRQWGQSLDRAHSNMLALCIMVIIDMETTVLVDSNSCPYLEALKEFADCMRASMCVDEKSWPLRYLEEHPQSSILRKLIQFMAARHCFSLEMLQIFLVQCLVDHVEPEYFQQVANHNNCLTLTLANRATRIDEGNLKKPDLSRENAQKQEVSEIIKYVILFTGQPTDQITEEEPASAADDSESHSQWQLRKTIYKWTDNDNQNGSSNSGLVEIKNTENIDTEIKKVLHDRTALFVPIIRTKLTSFKALQKSQILLSSILTELVAKFPSAHTRSKVPEAMEGPQAHRNKGSLQGTESAAHSYHNGPKIHEDFRIYIYHFDIVRATQLIAKALSIDVNEVQQKIQVRNISNPLNLNWQVSKILRVRTENRQKAEEHARHSSKNNMPPTCGVPNHMRNTAGLKTKKHINLSEEKDREVKTKPVNAMPSMHNLEQQVHNHNSVAVQTPHSVVSAGGSKTNKTISNQNGAPLAPFVHSIYETCNLLLSHIQNIVVLETGKMDRDCNFYNKWLLSDTYFNGMEKLLQPISADNESWNFYKTVSVICKIILNAISNSTSLRSHDHLKKFFGQAICRLEQIGRITGAQNSTQKISSVANQDKNKHEVEGQRVIELLQKMVQEDLDCRKSANNCITQQKINRFKSESELLHFAPWLNDLRAYLGLPSWNCKIQISLEQQSNRVTPSKVAQSKEAYVKRGSRRSKNPTSEIIKQKSKSPLQLSIKRESSVKHVVGLILDHEDTELAIVRTKPLNALTNYLFQRDSKRIGIKMNLIKKSIEQWKMVANQHRKGNHLNTNALLNLVLLSQGLIPLEIRSYIQQDIGNEGSVSMESALQKMSALKAQSERQKKMITEMNPTIDFCIYSEPIAMIKAYMRNEFEERINRASFDISESQCLQEPTKKQDSYYYCLVFSLTPEQMKDSRFIRLKGLWAIGWRLSSESMCEITQEDKLTQLSNVYLVKKMTSGQQMGVCSIRLYESEECKNEVINIHAFTKKSQGQKKLCKSAYLKYTKQ